jgi:hypothetical protein
MSDSRLTSSDAKYWAPIPEMVAWVSLHPIIAGLSAVPQPAPA